ncbi:MAG: prolipoprotein diacylglyceryl transferase [Dehalogenimonas sp.]|jgi:phosphatidylglycerol:prolipoprotein diacylglycerol transferase|uniref:Phosphatidylglycerol--prolipoprotein diacylglyceryl transferase n=1 Tax=Candidatus Dehalogenimonas loeffleri TaxID=3127115 RepID=A0ABZ2J125_9CHLR|nr:prolipoprotein diacylglyceryl transferase [Dehalogenimonas sp.]
MAFELGPLTIHVYGIVLALGALAGVIIAYIETKRRGLNLDHLFNMALIVLPMGVIGARAYHVIDQWGYYSQNPGQIIGGAGLGIFGALIGGVAGLLIYTTWRRLNPLPWLDSIAPGVILAQSVGRWGNYFNQELYGYPTDVPWGIFIDPVNRLPGFEQYTHFHPMFLYESLWNLSGFAFLMIIGRKWADKLKTGDIFILYLIYYGIGRFILEGFKIDVWTVGGIPTARWITGAAVIIGVAVLWYRHRKQPDAVVGEDHGPQDSH